MCASPADSDVTETLSTLRFASRAKHVRNLAKINATVDASAVDVEGLSDSVQVRCARIQNHPRSPASQGQPPVEP